MTDAPYIPFDIGIVFRVVQVLERASKDPEKYLTSHSFGMEKLGLLRIRLAPIDENQDASLHIWDKRLRDNDVSDTHTHPWHLKSFILSGTITDIVYSSMPGWFPRGSDDLYYQHYKFFPGDDPRAEWQGKVLLRQKNRSTFGPSEFYEHSPEAVHRTIPSERAVTYVTKRREGPDVASVYAFGPWVNARPVEENYQFAVHVLRAAAESVARTWGL